MKKIFAVLFVLFVSVISLFANGATEDLSKWPNQPIHIIGQSEAGSGPDIFVRELQPLLQKELDTSIVVENKAGSGGKLACDYVWKADPDGYTLLAHSSPLTTVTQISKECDYSIKDMKHIVSFDITPYAVLVKADSPLNDIDDLIEYCKTNKASNSNSGIGGAMYLQSRIMANALGIDYNEVPYNGTSPCTLAVMNGDVTFSVAAYDSAVNNDEVKVLCVLADERIGFLPDVPTIVEEGYSFPFMAMRRGIVAPKDTPDEIVLKLIDGFKKALSDPGFLEFAESSGVSIDLLFGDDYKKADEEYYDTAMQFIEFL